ncbi:MAG: DUF817 domain-containing protein [Gemmobacter sp.]|uniref:DUF817 domain-containing protein n=1 Tax=Gemmobacter sp. TaxID=1898957 RepID=UPI001A557789|nr:DUF817 domain-containing protein [Gemmobacter sp.]MBL8561233.1 DUF817 domain-containing protein [Gemmobacter sp.]
MPPITDLEHRLGRAAQVRLGPHALGADLALFVLKQGWACLFGGLLLAGILASSSLWQADWSLARYDALFLYALALQAIFLATGLETRDEARVILAFHLTGTAMEWFKVSAGSWAYPEPGLFKLYDVPLFSGFMYASVGSYIARVIRIFDMRFAPMPPRLAALALAVAIYVNFFAHHFLPDIRLMLFAATLLLYGRCRIHFRMRRSAHARWWWMPLPLAALLSAGALWLAENIGTLTGTWLYAGQRAHDPVSFAKLGSWYLLLYVAFTTVTLVSRPEASPPQLRHNDHQRHHHDQPESHLRHDG